MPLRITSAPVSGIKKRKAPSQVRPRASPFANHARSKPSVRPGGMNPKTDNDKHDDPALDYGPLPDLGLSRYVPESTPVDTVLAALQHIRDNMFEELPARAGMNSTRIAQVLNFRRSLPPLVSVAHVHTILDAPTQVEREIMELATAGKIRRLIVPGRGNDAAGLGDCLVAAEDWENLVRASVSNNALKGMLAYPLFYYFGVVNESREIPLCAFSNRKHVRDTGDGVFSTRVYGSCSGWVYRLFVVFSKRHI